MPADNYSIKLQIIHPFLDPSAMTETLKLQPTNSWRPSPTHTNSCWEYAKSIAGKPLDKAVSEFIDMLEPNAAYFKGLSTYAAEIAVIVESGEKKPLKDSFSPKDLARLADMYIAPGVAPAQRRF